MEHLDKVIGSIRRFGPVGPPYLVTGPASRGPGGEALVGILVLDTDEEVDYRFDDLMADPEEE